jgi:uncharacterized protein
MAMRLDDEQESSNFEVQAPGSTQAGFGGGGGLGLLGMIVPFVFSRFGCGGLAVLGVLFLVFSGLGNVGSMFSGGGTTSAPHEQAAPGQLTDIQRTSLKVLGSTERVWGQVFAASGARYTPTTLVFYSRNGQSGCGAAQSAMGPFYCPADKKIYIDTEFFDELKTRFNAPGDFPIGYVIAHEVGHHIQDLEGTRAMPCKWRWSCRRIAMPVSGRRRTRICWRRAMSKKGCAPRRRSATTPCSVRRDSARCPTASRTDRPPSGRNG